MGCLGVCRGGVVRMRVLRVERGEGGEGGRAFLGG